MQRPSRLIEGGSIAAFACGIAGLCATVIAGLLWLVVRTFTSGSAGSGSDMFNADPAENHANLMRMLHFGGLTIALLALAVLLGVVEMYRRGISVRPIRTGLIVAGVTGIAAVALELSPATYAWSVIPGVVCAASLISCFAAIAALRRRAR
jgi:hypothetical protein